MKEVLIIVLPYMVERKSGTHTKGVRGFLAFPYGTLTLASYVKAHAKSDHNITVLDLNTHPVEDAQKIVQNHLDDLNPSIVGITFTFDVSYKHVPAITQRIKAHDPATCVVMGGPAATVSYQEIIQDQDCIDAVCYSEGERAMCALVDAENPFAELENQPWVTRKSMQESVSPQSLYVENLNDVIAIDYTLVNISAYSMKQAFSPFVSYREESDVRQFFLVTSRGCPFKCVFCAEPTFFGHGMRYVDMDPVIDHVESLVNEYGMNVLTIYDDQLLLDQKRAKELFRRLIPFNLRIEMPNGVTLVYIDDELAGLMKQAGVDSIFLAIESGSDYVLREIIKKPLKISKAKPIIETLQRNDIFVQAFFIIGFPGEREIDREMTIDFIKDVGLDWCYFNFATPLRGSELHRICLENGWIDEKYLPIGGMDMMRYIIRPPGIDPERLERQVYLMNLDVNFVNNSRLKRGEYEVAARCFQEVVERHPEHPFAHYFLAEALDALGAKNDSVITHRNRYKELIENNPTWQERVTFFEMNEPSSLPS